MALVSGMVALLKPDWRLCRTRIFKKRSKKIGMIGSVDVVSYSYDSNGKIIEESKEKKLDGYTFVNFTAEPNISFISEVEKHTPLKVEIQSRK